MERLIRLRATVRSSFTRNFNVLKEELKGTVVDCDAIQVSMAVLEKKAAELSDLDGKIMELALDENGDLEQEITVADEYQRSFFEAKTQVSKILSTVAVAPGTSLDTSTATTAGSTGQRKFKLPKLELRRFGGDLKEWLPFWSQFEKIDKDEEIASEDKFQYLIQVPGSRARELVESFPPTAANYTKAVQSLKSRFGKEDLLVEVYSRELLSLVLQNTLQGKAKPSLPTLYDRLESKIRALETLGVTLDKCAAMLFPLVESAMPEELLRAWQRSGDVREADEPHQRLEKLLAFLKSEVETEERISLAMSGFGIKGEKTSQTRKRELSPGEGNRPTAAGLMAAGTTMSSKSCVFCSGPHNSADCFTAQKMSMKEKNKILQKKGCCYSCLRPGHGFRKCKAKLSCLLCSRKHVILMCPRLPQENSREATRPSKENTATKELISSEEQENQNLTSLENSPRVLLQTLRVRIRGNGTEGCVRALIDTGSQRSYILERTAIEMNYAPLREEVITHSLFGGIRTHARKHRCYKVHLESLDKTYKCNFDVLDQATICGNIPSIGKGPWMNELKKLNISITDNSDDQEPIQLLIGADVAGRLMTGQHQLLKSGPVAVKTLLGWTLMGKTPVRNKEPNAAMVVTSMYAQDATIELFKEDAEPVVKKYHKEDRAAAPPPCRRFRDNGRLRQHGGYYDPSRGPPCRYRNNRSPNRFRDRNPECGRTWRCGGPRPPQKLHYRQDGQGYGGGGYFGQEWSRL